MNNLSIEELKVLMFMHWTEFRAVISWETQRADAAEASLKEVRKQLFELQNERRKNECSCNRIST